MVAAAPVVPAAPGCRPGSRRAARLPDALPRWSPARILLVDQRRLPGELVEFPCSHGGEVAIGDPGDGRPRRAGDRPGRRPTGSPCSRRARRRRSYARIGAPSCAAAATSLRDEPADGGQPPLGRRPDDGPLRAASATWPRTARPSPPRCGPRPTRSRGGDPRPRRSWPSTAWPSCRATPDRALRLLTHCNTGPLACGQFGTALGVVQAAWSANRRLHVFVDETRPVPPGRPADRLGAGPGRRARTR